MRSASSIRWRLRLEVGGDAVGREVDALVAQHQARVERDQGAVAREGRDAARLDAIAVGERRARAASCCSSASAMTLRLVLA